MEHVSRASAARHLRSILLGQAQVGADDEVPATSPWSVTVDEPVVADPETHIELLFRKVLRERLEKMGSTITEKPGPNGNTWSITMPGGAHWRLEPQVLVSQAGTKPDFVLRSDRPDVPPTAIFTDGWQFHASPAVNRLADDAAKRQALRDLGYQVLGFTWEDLDGTQPSTATVPWLHPQAIAAVLSEAKDSLSPATVALVTRPTMDLLLDWVQRPDRNGRAQLARWMPLLVAPSLSGGAISADVGMDQVTLDTLDGASLPPGAKFGGVWHQGTIPIGVRSFVGESFEIAVVLDDALDALGHEQKASWREWLRLANLLNFREDLPLRIVTRTMLTGAPAAVQPSVAEAEESSRVEAEIRAQLASHPDWRAVAELATETEHALLVELLDLATLGLEAPTIGDEVGDGVPLSLAWPDRKVTVHVEDLDHETIATLRTDGWAVVEPEAVALRAALTV